MQKMVWVDRFFSVRRCFTDKNIMYFSETMTSRLKTVFLVTAVVLDESCSTLQPLFSFAVWFMTCKGTTSDCLFWQQAKSLWSCRGFLISGHSQNLLLRSHRAGTHEDAVVLLTPPPPNTTHHHNLFFLFYWNPLLSNQLCLCSWKTQQDYFNTQPPQTQR